MTSIRRMADGTYQVVGEIQTTGVPQQLPLTCSLEGRVHVIESDKRTCHCGAVVRA